MMLYIDNKPETSNYRNIMREYYHIVPIREYLMEKYEWSRETFDGIWWEIHGKCMSSFTYDQQTTLNKIIHRRLPCNHRENIYYEYHDALCLTCNSATETQDHIVTCKASESRNTIKKQFFQNLNKTMVNLNTDQDVQRVITECLYAYVEDMEIPHINMLVDQPNQLLWKAYNEQTRIGWDQFLKGRMIKIWKKLYDETQTMGETNRRNKSDKWGKDIIILGWKFYLDIWKERNSIEHDGKNGDQTNERKRERLITKIIWLHSKVKERVTEYGEELTKEELGKLPLANLAMMEVQLRAQKTNKNDLCNGDHGESQP
jgi:hypothetical protein